MLFVKLTTESGFFPLFLLSVVDEMSKRLDNLEAALQANQESGSGGSSSSKPQ